MRWMVERERHGLVHEHPDAPFIEAKPMGTALEKIFDSVKLESVDMQTALRNEWAQLVGDDNAAHTRPGPVENKTLTLFVKGQVWYAELRRVGVAELQKRIVARFGKTMIQRVTLKPE